MLPILTFAAGIAAGAVGVRMLKKSKAPAQVEALARKARGGMDRAGEGLRDVTVSGLTVVEKSSASLRAKLAREPAPPASDEAAHQPDAQEGGPSCEGSATDEKA